MKEMLEKSKASPEEHLKIEAANFVQVQIMRRFLNPDHGNEISEDEKHRREQVWIHEHAPAFRKLFNENIDEFLALYQKDKDALIDAVETLLEIGIDEG
ncbi:MAG: hypothetical protein KGI60_01570 [Patescibacteria group bacterium]|nr:hypothetical protein [Patescibacteria group bacterium]